MYHQDPHYAREYPEHSNATVSGARIQWLGQSGFKIAFMYENTEKVIYIDTWIGNPKYPASLGKAIPTDADLVLLTHAHDDHAHSALELKKASLKKLSQIACGSELSKFYAKKYSLKPLEDVFGLGKGGTLDLGWVKITSVSADHASSFIDEKGELVNAGEASGWVIRLANGISIYHSGDTNVFGDMKIINDLYKPTHLCLPIGGFYTMGPEEAAYAIDKFLTNARTIIPMHYKTSEPPMYGDIPALLSELNKRNVKGKRVIDSYKELLGQWMDLSP